MGMQQQLVPQARKKIHAELQRFIAKHMSSYYVETQTPPNPKDIQSQAIAVEDSRLLAAGLFEP